MKLSKEAMHKGNTLFLKKTSTNMFIVITELAHHNCYKKAAINITLDMRKFNKRFDPSNMAFLLKVKKHSMGEADNDVQT